MLKYVWTTEADLLDGLRTDTNYIESLISDTDSQMEIAKDESGALLACVLLRREPECCYVGMLAVNPELQAKGIGKKLLHTAEIKARTWRLPALRMTVIARRLELIQYYERAGYQRTGETEPFPKESIMFGIPKFEDLILVHLKKTLF